MRASKHTPGLLLLAFVGTLCGCPSIGSVNFDIDYQTDTVVQGGGLLASVIDVLPVFPGLTSFDVSSQSDFENNDTRKDLVREASLSRFELTITDPADGNFDFMDQISFLLSAPGLDRVRVAQKTAVPRGVRSFVLDLDAVDLAAYVRSDAMTFTTEVSGRQPVADTVVQAHLILDVIADLLETL